MTPPISQYRIDRSVVFLALIAVFAESAPAQPPEIMRPLPAVDVGPMIDSEPYSDGSALHFVADPSEYRTGQDVLGPQTPHLTSHKQGFFQKLSITGTEILRDGSDGVGIAETDVFAAFAVPAPTTDMPLLLIPTLEMDFLDAPTIAGLPPRLYATYLDFMWLPQFGERLRCMISVAPGWYSDFEGDSDDGFRLTGRGIARYDWVPDQLQIVLGVLYLDRLKTEVLPVGGIIWMPNDDLNFELIFPKAKIARRYSWGPGFEHWFYLGGGFGGNTWSIARPGGGQRMLDMLDWRLTLGWERKANGGAGIHFEVGYVFERELEFTAPAAEIKLDDTVLLRGGVVF